MDSKEFDLWRKSFFKDDFGVDQCLISYTQKADLESLMQDLKYYGNELQNQMSEILKNETEAIVNLAEQLTNLKSRIDNLSVPISQLQEEIRMVYDLIKNTEESYKHVFDSVKGNKSKQNHMKLKMSLIKCCSHINVALAATGDDQDLMRLERLVNNYSFQKIHLEELNLMTSDIDSIALNVENELTQRVNRRFLIALQSCDKDALLKCLRMYVNLQKEVEAHLIVQVNILRPELQALFNESYLEKCSYNLDKIYKEVVKVLESKIGILSTILEENSHLTGFNFVQNSFWKEFDKQSTEGLPHISAPGNAELFHKRFTSTCNLLQFIAKKCGSENLVHTDQSFLNHLKRFNLPVYFEIIYQKVANQFECDVYSIKLGNSDASQNEHNFNVKPTLALWGAVSKCFDKDVYIDHLSSQFLKLAMMILSRYVRVLETILLNHISSGSDKKWDDFALEVLIDLSIVETLIASDKTVSFETTIFSITNVKVWSILPNFFKANKKVINKIREFFQNQLVDAKIVECTKHLQQVQAIPRLYRRTNRSQPKTASTYMVEAVKPILEFHNKFKSKADSNLNQILNSIIFNISTQYLSLVQEVLMSVCKTEESLRRLKSRISTTDGASPGSKETVSDEMKIREQIKYDVGYFLDKSANNFHLAIAECLTCLNRSHCCCNEHNSEHNDAIEEIVYSDFIQLSPLALASSTQIMNSLRREVY